MSEFDDRAADWDERPGMIERAEAVADAIAAAVPVHSLNDVLEFGAGTGSLSFAFAKHAEPGGIAHLVMVDTSAGMLEVARQKLASIGDARQQGWQIIDDDLTADHGLPPDCFDLVMSQMTLHHIEDIPALLARFATILRPGGWLAICDLDADQGGFHQPQPAAEGEEPHTSPHVHHHGFDRDELAGQLTAAGFGQPSFSTPFVEQREDREFPLFLAVAQLTR